ncbi:MAG TPA: recombinase RecQ [Cyanobacteria bacterium UBA11149]|nr:recombinase RecQ [Cyanobacteria bacterium UBA11367]HBE56404.1 recombinase RecQ [Cyanobacteria bacterium UBA11366]HBK62910.1 recombinase RecQ [Cyanobacteria bacterium UBA11166]HBR73869.1 recombinase RecQ [Cyanobacteria bacterium UBA11159]HBS69946.1 recombinase RecQ [Cyanobacteria bacterium UBA11153]HBW90449.1 recombinase RecQ [Cyanobacteria bacterium UBA11149]HCA97115.1 recombinase RecQ [Cyanobacteria bacterium UBA9226]
MKYPAITSWDDVRLEFKKIWGYDDFRPPQGEIVRSLLDKRDSLIVLPTGGGKSICFQLPALLQSGLTLVISPLVALMENQVQELKDRNLPAALLHSELPSQQRRKIMEDLERQELRLLYLSPETLLSEAVWERLCQPQLEINGLILDEAHCLVQWGDTFRPAYRRLGAVRQALLKCKPPGTKIAIAAFTATADTTAQATIQKVLKLQQPKFFLISPYRDNLNLKVQTVWTPRGRRQKMLKFIQARSRQSGLVYVRSRRDSEELAQWFEKLGYATAAYHAGLSAEERRKIEGSWLDGSTQFVICTSAFGMGINKPDVRWVVHFQAPQLLSEYIQEVGRGGRDGLPADALTLISEPTGWLNPEDKQRQSFFVNKLRSQYKNAQKLVKKLPLQGEVKTIATKYRDGEIALALLHSADRLEWLDPFSYRKNPRVDSSSLAKLSATQEEIQSQMTQYFSTRDCRWQFLLREFGFTKEAIDFRCERCDNCLKSR